MPSRPTGSAAPRFRAGRTVTFKTSGTGRTKGERAVVRAIGAVLPHGCGEFVLFVERVDPGPGRRRRVAIDASHCVPTRRPRRDAGKEV